MASIFLQAGEAFDVFSGSHTIFGSSSGATVNILNASVRVNLDSNISYLKLPSGLSDYKYKVNGTTISFGDASNNTIVEFIGLNQAVTVEFNDGATSSLSLNGLNNAVLDNQSISSSGFDDLGSSSILAQAQAKSSTNSGTETLPSTGDSPALESGEYWSSTSVTYSYNLTEPADYAGENLSGFIAFPDAAKPSVESSFADIATFTPLTFSEVSVDGDIEWNAVQQEAGTDAYAYYPGSGIGGDVFLSNEYTTSEQYTAGQSPFFTVIHELGHAMGLDHSFEGEATLPADEENHAHSVMSYTNYHDTAPEFTITDTGSGSNISVEYMSSYYTTGYSLYDVIGLQAAYGVNTTHNNTDNTYTVGFGTTVQEVIWDAGGTDLIDASAATGACTVDLRDQKFSSIDVKDSASQAAAKITELGITDQTFIDYVNTHYTSLNNDNLLYTGEMNLAISKGVVIENVTTGSANDSVQDNSVDNVISTGAGDDIIMLNQGGFDTVNGGTGTDTVQLSIASSAAQVEKQTDGSYIVLADSFAAQLTGIENLQFTDTTTTLV